VPDGGAAAQQADSTPADQACSSKHRDYDGKPFRLSGSRPRPTRYYCGGFVSKDLVPNAISWGRTGKSQHHQVATNDTVFLAGQGYKPARSISRARTRDPTNTIVCRSAFDAEGMGRPILNWLVRMSTPAARWQWRRRIQSKDIVSRRLCDTFCGKAPRFLHLPERLTARPSNGSASGRIVLAKDSIFLLGKVRRFT